MARRKRTSYAVDFDGTLCTNAWPEIGRPNTRLINFLKARRKLGERLILWTMREGELLDAARRWCEEQGLTFDAVNDNLPDLKADFGNNPRKVYADYYLDDHNWPWSVDAETMKQDCSFY